MLKLILLPGMDGTGKLYEPLIHELGTAFNTQTLQYPTDTSRSYDELLPLVEAALPKSDPYVLLAESFSTPLAVMCAARASTNLKGLILCAGFVTSPLRGWRKSVVSHVAPNFLGRRPPDLVIRSFMAGPNAPPELLAAVRSAIASVHPAVLVHRLRMILTCDARADLAKIDVPILYLQATHDRLVPPSCLDEIRRIKPTLTALQLRGPHLLLQREPAVSPPAISEWLQRITTAVG